MIPPTMGISPRNQNPPDRFPSCSRRHEIASAGTIVARPHRASNPAPTPMRGPGWDVPVVGSNVAPEKAPIAVNT